MYSNKFGWNVISSSSVLVMVFITGVDGNATELQEKPCYLCWSDLLYDHDHVIFAELVMVGQSKLMPGQMPGFAWVWLRLCLGYCTVLLEFKFILMTSMLMSARLLVTRNLLLSFEQSKITHTQGT